MNNGEYKRLSAGNGIVGGEEIRMNKKVSEKLKVRESRHVRNKSSLI